MSNAFGFARYPQQKAPPAEAVGMALFQQGQQQGQQQPMQAPMMAPAPMASPDAMLRADGAHRMTGGGQIDDGLPMEDGHSANALNVAVGEALTRLGGGYSTNPNPFKPRAESVQRLQQLGLSAVEAHLLLRTGGV